MLNNKLQSKLIIIFNNRLPTERAHGIQIAKMCESFGEFCDTELWIPKAANTIKEDIYKYYGLKNNFKIQKKWCINLLQKIFHGGIIYRFRYFTFLISLFFSKKEKTAIFFTRHPEIVFLLTLLKFRVFFENHNWYQKKNKIKKNLFLVKKAAGIVVTTKAIKNEFINHGFRDDKILVAPNGVDLAEFDIKASQVELRKELNLPQDKKIILYTGHLYQKKGVYTLAEAGKYLSAEFKIIFIGGLPKDIKRLKQFSKNINTVEILGTKKYFEIPKYLKAADILAITNSSKYSSENKYTCPLKLFAYLAAGKVIVASNVPSLCEFVDENSVVFFKSDDAKSLTEAIKNISKNKEKQNLLKINSKQKSHTYTWHKRAERILNFFIPKVK